MLVTVLAGAALVAVSAQEFDTVLAVRRGARLDVNNLAGEIVIRTWDRDQVRVTADESRRVRTEVTSSGAVVRVRARARRGHGSVDYVITVPNWMDLDLAGTFTDVIVEDAGGQVTVETVQGDVAVTGGGGLVSINSVHGDLLVEGSRGRVFAKSVDGDVTIRSATGEIVAETLNGDIGLDLVTSNSVQASALNGEIIYRGAIEDGGRYFFGTHNGDLVILIPEAANATVTVRTVHGEFESEFPITLTDMRPVNNFTFTLGSGSARVELEAFNGTIELRRRR